MYIPYFNQQKTCQYYPMGFSNAYSTPYVYYRKTYVRI